MANKKGQGLSLSFIVIAALVALVLVIVAAFTIGGLGEFFGRIFGGAQTVVGKSLDDVRTVCTGYCDQAKRITTTTNWDSSTYCTRTFDIDLDGDGVIGTDEAGLTCWNENLGVDCAVSISTPAGVVTCTNPTGATCDSSTDCVTPTTT